MNFFSLQRVWVFISIFLLMTNVATIVTIYWKRHSAGHQHHSGNGGNHHKRKNDFFTEKLGLTTEQEKQYTIIDSLFEIKKTVVREKVGKQKKLFIDCLSSGKFSEQTLDSMARLVSNGNADVELLRLEAVIRLNALCTPAQREKLEELLRRTDLRRNKGAHH